MPKTFLTIALIVLIGALPSSPVAGQAPPSYPSLTAPGWCSNGGFMNEYIRQIVIQQGGTTIWSWSQSYGPYITGSLFTGHIVCPPSPLPPANGVSLLTNGPTIDFAQPFTILVRVETPYSFQDSVGVYLDLNADYSYAPGERFVISTVAPPGMTCAAPAPIRVPGPTFSQAFDDSGAVFPSFSGSLPSTIMCRVAAVFPNVCTAASLPTTGSITGWVVEFPITATSSQPAQLSILPPQLAINRPEAGMIYGPETGNAYGLASYMASTMPGTLSLASSIPGAVWNLVVAPTPLAVPGAGATILPTGSILNININAPGVATVFPNGTSQPLPFSINLPPLGPINPSMILQMVVLDPSNLNLWTSQPVLLF